MLGITQSLAPLLKCPILVEFLRPKGSKFRDRDPLHTKLLLASVSLVFGMMMFPDLLSFNRNPAIYSGSPVCLILKTVNRVW